MYYSGIKAFCIENGPGVRVSLFVSGCRNCCKGCFQPETWNFCYGKPFTNETENEILKMLQPVYIEGLTLLGGDPFEPENQEALLPFIRKVKELYPEKNIWAYTGYLVDKDLVDGGKVFTVHTKELLSYIDVMVDGPFIEEQKNLGLAFRGSENQRIIDMNASRKSDSLIILEMDRTRQDRSVSL